MTPQEAQRVTELFERLASLEDRPRDAAAEALIARGLQQAPNAVYALVQTVLVQDEALHKADARIRELEAGGGTQGSFLDSMREALFGGDRPRGSVPQVRAQSPGGPLGARVWQRLCPERRCGPTAGGSGGGLVPRHSGGGRSRRNRRFAPARQHPLPDRQFCVWACRQLRQSFAMGRRSSLIRRRSRHGSRRQ
jgi:hypothetical protein